GAATDEIQAFRGLYFFNTERSRNFVTIRIARFTYDRLYRALVDFHERIGVAALCVQVERDHMKSGKSGNVFKFNAAAVAFRLHHQGATLVVACSGSYNAFVEEGPVAVGAEKESVVG